MRTITASFVVVLAVSTVVPVNAQSGQPVPDEVLSPCVPGVGCLCPRPWIIPDKWTELSDPPNSTFDPGVDVYDSGYTDADIGTRITFAPADRSCPKVQMGTYFPIRFAAVNDGGPDRSGAKWYYTWIVQSSSYGVSLGDTFRLEAGGMVKATERGITELLAMDPTASYDSTTKTISNTEYGDYTPRLVQIMFFNPANGLVDKQHVVMARIARVFIEEYDARGAFTGRYMGEVPDDPPWPWPDALPLSAESQSMQLAGPRSSLAGDITQDGVVNQRDLSALIAFMMSRESEGVSAASMDLTGDGKVDLKDLAVLTARVK